MPQKTLLRQVIRESEALLIVELDGPKIEVDFLISRVEKLAAEAGADTVRISNSDEEREMFWKGRKSAFPAVNAFRQIIIVWMVQYRAKPFRECCRRLW